jgi:hypothetical protein
MQLQECRNENSEIEYNFNHRDKLPNLLIHLNLINKGLGILFIINFIILKNTFI